MQTFKNNYYWNSVFNHNWDILGKISSFWFDISKWKIIWFFYGKNFWDNNFFYITDILKIKNNKIFIQKKDYLNKDFYQLISKQVKNDRLSYIWYVYDVELDFNFKIKNLIINNWYDIFKPNTKIKNKLSISKESIISYNRFFIIINDKNLSLNNTIENIYNFFINIQSPNYFINKKKYDNQ